MVQSADYKTQIKQQPIVREMMDVVRKADPTARLVLYGSRARGDHRADSDWDLLVLVKQDKVRPEDRARFWDSMYDVEMQNGAEINTTVYSLSHWNRTSFTPFHHNVENDGIVLL